MHSLCLGGFFPGPLFSSSLFLLFLAFIGHRRVVFKLKISMALSTRVIFGIVFIFFSLFFSS